MDNPLLPLEESSSLKQKTCSNPWVVDSLTKTYYLSEPVSLPAGGVLHHARQVKIFVDGL